MDSRQHYSIIFQPFCDSILLNVQLACHDMLTGDEKIDFILCLVLVIVTQGDTRLLCELDSGFSLKDTF